MKKLLNTLYILSEDAYLALDGENVVAWKDKTIAGRIPLHTLTSIVCFSYKGASPALMGECASRGLDLVFFSPRGRFLARTSGMNKGSLLLQKRQYEICSDEKLCCEIARNMLLGKVFNARWVIERAKRDHPLQVDLERLKARSQELARYLDELKMTDDLGALRGIEGAAARSYFDVFNELILTDRGEFHFEDRSRRPPTDKVNAMLSFGYSLLSSDYASALEGVGLDSRSGFLHADRPGRSSLALDMVEELRSAFVDRVVLSAINKRIVGPADFDVYQDGAVLLNEKGRKAFLEVWQAKKKDVIRHPYLGEKIEWGLVPHVQSLLLARYIRGDIDGYPPFLWK